MDNLDRKPLILYGHDYCGQSLLLKQTLQDHHVEYEWRDVLNGDSQY